MSRVAYLLAGCCTLQLAATLYGQSPVPNSSPVFVSGQNGINTYRIPAIVRSTNGTLLAFCEARVNSSADSGQIEIALRRSTNNGAAWNAMQIVALDGANSIGNPAPVVDEVTGNIFLLFCKNNSQVFYSVSSDDGISWSNRVEITGTCKQADWGWYATGPGHGIQLKRGAQAARLVVPADHQRTNGVYGDHVIYSDDHGVTWQLGAVQDAANNINPNENLAVELVSPGPAGGAQLYFASRDNNGTAAGNRSVNWSTNGGSAYVGVFTNDTRCVCPVCQAGLLRFSATDQGATTNRILFSCPNNSASRVNLSLWSSTNEAASWSAPKSIYSGPSAYSDMALAASGNVVLLAESGTNSAYETITAYTFNQAWLDSTNGGLTNSVATLNPVPAFWNFDEKAPGAMCSTGVGAILDVSPAGYQLNLTAQGALAYVSGATNFGAGAALQNYGFGSALHFDGTNGLQISAAASSNHLDFGANDSFTIEAVFRVASNYTATAALVAKDFAASSPSYWLRLESGKVRFFVDDTSPGAWIYSTNTVNDGQWHHVVAIRDATNPTNKTLSLWLDGVFNTNGTDTTSTLANAQAFNIGRFNVAGRNLTGDMDFVRITPAVLASTQFVQKWTQWDANGNWIPDSFERNLTNDLSLLGSGNADADGDGFADVVEFAQASNPLDATSRPLMQAALGATNVIVSTHQRALPPWLAIQLQSSLDLKTWTPRTEAATLTALPDGNYLRQQSIPFATNPPAAQFFRFGVLYQP